MFIRYFFIYLLLAGYASYSHSEWIQYQLPNLTHPFGSTSISHLSDGTYVYAQNGNLYKQDEWNHPEFSDYPNEPQGIDPSFITIFDDQLGFIGSGGFTKSAIYRFNPEEISLPNYSNVGPLVQNFHGVVWDSSGLLIGGADTGPLKNHHGIRFLSFNGSVSQILIDDISIFSTGFDVDKAGNLYVGDNDDGRVYFFDKDSLKRSIESQIPLAVSDGTFIFDFGEGGNIGSISVDGLGRIWATGFLHNGIRIYDPFFKREFSIIPNLNNSNYKVASFIRCGTPYISYTNQEAPSKPDSSQFYGFDTASSYGQHTPFTAYNDLSWQPGQPFQNITRYTTLSGQGDPPEGNQGKLIDFSTGKPIQAELSVFGGAWNGEKHASFGSCSEPGTDGYQIFNDKLDCSGVISYGRNNIVLTFSKLNSFLKYSVKIFGNRDMNSYSNRFTATTISGVAHFSNLSSDGAQYNGGNDETTVIANGYNTVNGYIVHFTNIDPGSNGEFSITLSGTSETSSNQYINAVCLEELPLIKPVISSIMFSNNSTGAEDTTEFFQDENLHVKVWDENLDPFQIPLSKIKVELSQDTYQSSYFLSYQIKEIAYSGMIPLKMFHPGPVDITIMGFIGDVVGTETEVILHRKSTIHILE